MATPRVDTRVPRSAWRMAAVPVVALLGVVLPLIYLPQLEDYLYYFRPADLVPAYGTAWVFLAVLVLPFYALLALLLRGLGSHARLRPARALLAAALIGAAAAECIGAALYCLLVWVQSFGLLSGWSLMNVLLWPALAGGVWVAASRHGRALAESARGIAIVGTVVGACAALTLPFASWTRAPEVAAAFDPPPAGYAQAAAPPHILLLTIDALSAEHMSLYGAPRPTTPELSAFAQGATTFDRAYANANFTTPGVASILTGTRPWTHRALQLPSWPDMLARRVSLPALLQQAGYQTAYVSTNAAAGASKNGLGGYFDFASRDRIRDLNLCTDTLSALFKYACPIAAMPFFGQLVTYADRLHGGRDTAHYDPRLATEPALTWLQQADKSKPIFLWVHLFPPHSPYAAPPPWLGSFDASTGARDIAHSEPHWGFELSRVGDAQVQLLAARYDESVAYADYYAGDFLQRALQLLGDNTVVVVTADHGESFRHGYGAHTGPGLFDEIIHVPLIIKLPGQSKGLRSHATAEQVDIAPTLAQLAGISAPPEWEGRSLLPACTQAASGTNPALADKPAFSMNFEQNPRFSRLANGVVAVVSGHWKLVHYLGQLHYPQMPPLQDALFDLAVDPAESMNVASAQPAITAQLRALIDDQLAQHGRALDDRASPRVNVQQQTHPNDGVGTRDASGLGT
jgi:arylsulfatase A-like enzyme